MGLSVSGDAGTEHVAFSVAVHAVMHNLFLQERCVTTSSYISDTGQRPRRSLCQERCSQGAAVAMIRVKRQ